MRVPIIALASLAVLAAPSSGRGGLDASHPATVGSLRIPAAAPAVLDAQIAAAWRQDEAEALGVAPGAVADALAGADARGIPDRFERYHERHRAATRCLPEAHDPFADRCVDRAPAPQGTCRWMGETTICRVARGWLVVHGQKVRRHRRRGAAVADARAAYLRARSRRDRLARAAAADRHDAVAELRRAEAVARLAARRAEPRLAAATLSRGRRACILHRQDAEPYAFALGMQDPVGQAEGLLVARAFLARRLRAAAADGIDRAKLRGFLAALRSGDRSLRGLRDAGATGDVARLYRSLSDYDARTRREARLAARLGLADCARR